MKQPLPLSLTNLSIGVKLTIGFGVLVFLTLAVGGLSYFGSTAATEGIERTANQRVPTALVAVRAQATLLRMISDARGYLALGSQEGEQNFRASYTENERRFRDDLAELDRLSPNLTPENQRRVRALRETFEQRWAGLPDRLFELRDDQLDREPAYRLLTTDGSRSAGQTLININSIIGSQALREPTTENIRLLGDMARFQGTFASMFSGLRGYVTTRNRIFRQEYEVNRTANEDAWETLQGEAALLTPGQQAALTAIARERTAFLGLPDQIIQILEGEHWREDLFLFRTRAIPLADTMEKLLGELTDDQQTRLQTELNAGRVGLATANQQILVVAMLALLIGIALAVIFRARIVGPVRRLTAVAGRIQGGDLEQQARVESHDEIGILAETFNNMTGKLSRTLEQISTEKRRASDLLDVVIPMGVTLSAERDFNRLLEKMVVEAMEFCRADGGILYLRTQDEHLRYVMVRGVSRGLAYGGTTGAEPPFPRLTMAEPGDAPATGQLAIQAAVQGQATNLHPPAAGGALLVEHRIFDHANGADDAPYPIVSALTLPLKNNEGDALGVLQLLNASDQETGQLAPFDANLHQMMESFSSLAAAALEAYIREQSLRHEIQQLRIEIDESRRQKQVSEIVDTDFFQELQTKARGLRQRRAT